MSNNPAQPGRRALLRGLAGVAALATTACAEPASPSAGTPRGEPTRSELTPAAASPLSTPSGPPAAATTPGPDIEHADTGRHEVALTFHGAGDAAIADAVLAILAEHRALMTVFAVGRWVDADPAVIRRIAQGGHEVGNHTWSHLDMPSLDEATARAEIRRGRETLVAALGQAGWWFRPSGTHHSTETIRAAARAEGYAVCVSYDVDPEDFKDPGAAAVRERTAATVSAGSIVSLHLGHQGTVEALPGILADLAAKGLQPVSLSTLVQA